MSKLSPEVVAMIEKGSATDCNKAASAVGYTANGVIGLSVACYGHDGGPLALNLFESPTGNLEDCVGDEALDMVTKFVGDIRLQKMIQVVGKSGKKSWISAGIGCVLLAE